MRGTSFNVDVWRERAWAKFLRSFSRGEEKQKIERRWAEDVMAIRDIETVIQWCESKKIVVIFKRIVAGLFTSYEKKYGIEISHNTRPTKQLCYILHEVGHYLIGLNEHSTRFTIDRLKNGNEKKNTLKYKIVCLEEEFEAWNRGKKLAQRLGLNVTQKDFDKTKIACMKTYVTWVNK